MGGRQRQSRMVMGIGPEMTASRGVRAGHGDAAIPGAVAWRTQFATVVAAGGIMVDIAPPWAGREPSCRWAPR